ncbi:MAG: hypothetical protein ACE5WD_11515 [Candidatus Aminicenantia bacterium]
MDSFKKLTIISIMVLGIIFTGMTYLKANKEKELRFNFEKRLQGWTAFAGGKVLLTRENVKEGKNALEFRYIIKPQQFAAVGVGNLNLAGIRKISFWVKTDVPSLLVVAIEERDGSSYNYAFSTQKKQWQKIEFGIDSFELDDDSQDENDRLDIAQVNGLLIVDAASFFGGKAGPRTLWLDDFQASEKPFIRPDYFSFDQDLKGWSTIFTDIGSLSVTNDPENIKQGKGALEFSYELKKDKFLAVFTKGVDLSQMKKISFWLKTDEPSIIVIGIKERDKSEYNYLVQTGKEKWVKVEIKPEQFNLSDDSNDENNKLDIDQLDGSLVILDADNFFREIGKQKLWIDELKIHSVKNNMKETTENTDE